MKYREVVTYKNYFEDFFKIQNRKVQDKIIKVLDILENVERVPITYLNISKVQTDFLKFGCNLGQTFLGYSVALMGTG